MCSMWSFIPLLPVPLLVCPSTTLLCCLTTVTCSTAGLPFYHLTVLSQHCYLFHCWYAPLPPYCVVYRLSRHCYLFHCWSAPLPPYCVIYMLSHHCYLFHCWSAPLPPYCVVSPLLPVPLLVCPLYHLTMLSIGCLTTVTSSTAGLPILPPYYVVYRLSHTCCTSLPSAY